jgi:hypothetical protein
MTSITWPDHLLTLEEWNALPEDFPPLLVRLDAFVLTDGAYRPSMVAATGDVTMTEPAPVTVDLPALVP